MSSQSSPSNSDLSLSKGSSEAINYKYKDPYDYWSKVENLHNPKYTWQENYVYSVLPEKARIKIDKLPIDKQKQMLLKFGNTKKYKIPEKPVSPAGPPPGFLEPSTPDGPPPGFLEPSTPDGPPPDLFSKPDSESNYSKEYNKLSPSDRFNYLVNEYYNSQPYQKYMGGNISYPELEVRFGTKSVKNLSKTDFDNVIKKLKSFGFECVDSNGVYGLRMYNEFLDNCQ